MESRPARRFPQREATADEPAAASQDAAVLAASHEQWRTLSCSVFPRAALRWWARVERLAQAKSRASSSRAVPERACDAEQLLSEPARRACHRSVRPCRRLAAHAVASAAALSAQVSAAGSAAQFRQPVCDVAAASGDPLRPSRKFSGKRTLRAPRSAMLICRFDDARR